MRSRSLQEESVSDRLVRAQVARFGVMIPFIVLLLIFFRYQLLQTSEYALHSVENRLRRIDIEPPRGLILDRNGEVLAENILSYNIEIYPQPVDSMTAVVKNLAPLFELSDQDCDALLKRYESQRLRPLRVATDIDQKTMAVVEEHRSHFPGIAIRFEMKRSYVYGDRLSHVIGYVGEITDKELEERGEESDYMLGSLIGRSGIESMYEKTLRGKRGVKFIEVDARGRELGPFRDRLPVLPERGEDVRLTIDVRLQQAMYDVMQEIERGSMVCMDPNSGEILAMISKPVYDPNILSAGISGNEWRRLLFHPDKPFLNRAIQGTYPPGSTFKLLSALIGLKEGVIGTDGSGLTVTCNGGLQYGRRFFKCWERGGHGRVNYFKAISQSCDTFFYTLGIKVGLNQFCESIKASEFLDKTGIDLPNEEAGLVPDEAWYSRFYGKGNWGPGNVLNLSIGQGEITMTPLQLVRFYGFLASGGKRYIPHLRIDESRNYLDPLDLFSEKMVAMLRDPMIEVVNGPRGTARGSRLWGHEEKLAGKTGTSQNPHGEDHGLFAGFFPAEKPEIAIAIVVEHGIHGSTQARLVRDFVLKYIEIRDSDKGITPEMKIVPDSSLIQATAIEQHEE